MLYEQPHLFFYLLLFLCSMGCIVKTDKFISVVSFDYTMEKTIKELQRKERKSMKLGLRIKKSESVWMKKHNVSPQRLWDESLKELMEKTKK